MKIKNTLHLALWCVMFCSAVANAQERLMFSRPAHNYDHPDSTNGLYYLNKDGSGVAEQATNFLPMHALGATSQYFFVSKDGELVGANSDEGDEPDYGNGTLYRITAKGIVITHHFSYPVNRSMPLEESPVNNNLYTVGLGASGEYLATTGTKYDGFTESDYYPNYGLKQNTDHLMVSKEGEVFSTAPIGGVFGQGYIFKWAGSKIQVLYSFSKPTGHYPRGKLLEGTDGYLYGVTKRGGDKDYGVVFKVKVDGTDYKVLHSFSKTDGQYPNRGLVQSTNGNLYSMTPLGGANNLGVIFRIKPDGTGFKKLHDIAFTRGTTHGFPQNLLIDNYGYLYGKFPAAAGTIFRIRTDGTDLKILYDENTTIYNLQLVNSINPAYKLVIPSKGATNVSTSYVFKADSVPGAISYSLELSQQPDFSASSITHSSTSRFLVRGLTPSKKYYARVRTSLWLRPGPVTTFTTSANTLTSAVTTPADGASGVPVPTLTITIKAVAGASTYTVELSESPYFDGNIITGVTDNNHRTFRMYNIDLYKLYYARVKTDVAPGYGKITSFTTGPAAMRESTGSESQFLTVYPNPSTSNFRVQKSGDDNAEMKVQIIDRTGTIIENFTLQETERAIQFGETLPKGIYVLRIFNGKNTTQKRLVKQ